MALPKLAVYKFASCDGCQLSILDVEDLLLDIASVVHIANFPEASREVVEGPYDLTLVEGSITTPHDAERIHEIRRQSKYLVTIGACATAGGIQALRNGADLEEWKDHVYPHPEWLSTLPCSTPIADHVRVDHEIHGCPVNPQQVLRVLSRLALGSLPDLPGHSVCVECKRRGLACVVVTQGLPCLGPVTRAGCGALCPAQGRECYACFGPSDAPNTDALAAHLEASGIERRDVARRFQGLTGWEEPFRATSARLRDSDD